MLRHESCQLDEEKVCCENCGVESKLYRCRECVGELLLCALCLLDEHKRLPLHRIEVSGALYLWGKYTDQLNGFVYKVLEWSFFCKGFAKRFGTCPTDGT